MAIAPVARAYLVGHESVRPKLIERLQKVGIIEITNLKQNIAGGEFGDLVRPFPEPEITGYETMLANLQYGINFLVPYKHKRGFVADTLIGLIEGLFGAKFIIEKKEFERIGSEIKRYLSICDRCRELETELGRLGTEEAKCYSLQEQMHNWVTLSARIEDIGESKKTKSVLGIIESGKFSLLQKELDKIPEHVATVVNTERGEHYIFLIYIKERSEEIEELLRKYEFRKQTFPGLTGAAKEILSELSENINKIENEKAKCKNESIKLSERRNELMVAYDYLSIEKNKAEVVANFARTQNTFIVEGWVKLQDADALCNIAAEFHNIEVSVREPKSGEQPPACLENKKVFQPFQIVTNLYGTPAYTEIDPTPFLAPFFLLFFALCLTDAGYGLVLIALSLFAMKKIRGGRGFFLLMLGCGAVTVFTGALTGSFFGNLFGVKALWVDPMVDPIPFLLLALMLGVVQTIYFGPLIKMHQNIKSKQFKAALYDQFFWMLFLTCVLFLLLNQLGFFGVALRKVFNITELFGVNLKTLGASISQYVLYVAIAGAIIVVATKGRHHKKLGKRLATGLASIYGISSYVGDILSYSRLLALGMTTSVIAMVVNNIAFMAFGMPYVGIVFAIVILIFGHAFNLIINSLGGFIHTVRLQFVEFFPKFLESTGKGFKPFTEAKKYIELK